MKIYYSLAFIFQCTNSDDTAVHNRRTLHQSFFPFDSPAATPSSFSSSFDIPFTPPAEQPFFPKIPTPPRPPPPSPASFPSNIPSTNLPNSPKPAKPVSGKLTATAATLAIFASIVAAVAVVVFLRIRKRRSNNSIEEDLSSSRPAFVAVPADNYEPERINGLDYSSCSSSSGPGCPARSISLSTSPRASLSSITSSPNSPDLVTIQTAPTPPLPPPPPVRSPVEMLKENEKVGTSKPKLKPLHWDKVRASSDRETVWDQIKSSSFELNEEIIETLFIVKTPKSPTTNRPIPPWPRASQENRVLDPKKSQNIAILLKALHVTIEEVCDALLEGNADMLGMELLESLLKMAPTKEEEWKLKQCKDDMPVKLGPAEKFLKAVYDVPFAFKQVGAMLYVSNFKSEVEYLKRSFQTLEV
ncbi:uncharacterized protein LOC143631846 [Bidens hawaiensis]|uniref:uncharacterized protein LOC143631846 n=1 Tax=Bidens hawaiensis TaxID=980011 RepID=UPI00404A23C4